MSTRTSYPSFLFNPEPARAVAAPPPLAVAAPPRLFAVPPRVPFASAAIKAVKEGPRGTVLQLPVGDGRLIAYFAQVMEFVTGVDTERSAVDAAGEAVERRGLVNCNLATVDDFQDLSLADRQYATVLCPDFLGHLRRPEHVLREVMRVLRPGGCAVLEFFAPGDSTRHAPKRSVGADSGSYRDETFFRYFDQHSLEDTLSTAGIPRPWRIERRSWDESPGLASRSALQRRESWIVTARKS